VAKPNIEVNITLSTESGVTVHRETHVLDPRGDTAPSEFQFEFPALEGAERYVVSLGFVPRRKRPKARR